MKHSRSAAHRRIVTGWVTSPPRRPVEPRPGPEKVRVIVPERTKARPLEEALAPLRGQMQRRAGTEPQPPVPASWPGEDE